MTDRKKGFDLNDGCWESTYWHCDYSCGFSGDFFDCLHCWGIHCDWIEEMARLARLHGGLNFGDEDLGLRVSHEGFLSCFPVYWTVSGPRQGSSRVEPSLFDLIETPVRKKHPRPTLRPRTYNSDRP